MCILLFFHAVKTKPAVGSLKRKSDSDATGEMTAGLSDCALLRDAAPPLSPAPGKNAGTTAATSR